MIKNILKTILALTMCFALVGCQDNTTLEETDNKDVIEDTSNLKDINLEWCQLYNPNGFDTITCVISNPNKIDIDVSYDMVFYKDGKEVDRKENWSNFNISPKHKDVIWANVDILKDSEVDEIKLENIYITEAYSKSIDAKIEYIGAKESFDRFSVKYDKEPYSAYLYFFLYNDKNKNGKCDKGELVITDIEYTNGKEDVVEVATDVVGSIYGKDYTKYEMFYNAVDWPN